MKRKGTLRISAAAAILAAAVSANAFTLNVTSVGSFNVVGPNLTFTEVVSFFQSSSIAAPVFATQNSSVVNMAPPTSGTGILNDGAGNSISYTLSVNSAGTTSNGIWNDGTWAYTGGTGFYAGLAGGGTFTEQLDTSSGIPGGSLGNYVGELNSVPEPASMAFLGLGVIGLMARRRRN